MKMKKCAIKIFLMYMILVVGVILPIYGASNSDINLKNKVTPFFITSIQIANKNGKKSEIEKTTDKWKYGYGTVQGFTTDGESFYIVAANEFNKTAAKKANGGLERYAIIEKHTAKIVKVNRKTKKITKLSEELKIGHGNCLTYKDGKLYIASAGVKKDEDGKGDPGYGKSVLYVVDAKTLKPIEKETKYLETPYKFTSIAWNELRKEFYLGSTNGQIWVFDENLNKVGFWKGLKDPEKKDDKGNPQKLHYTQTFFVDGTSFYVLSWEHTQEKPVRRQNFILEYDLNGNYIQRINIFANKSQMEIEDMCMYNGKYYIVSNSYRDGTAKIHSIDLKDTSNYYDICFTDQEKLVTQVKQADGTIDLVRANHTYQKIEYGKEVNLNSNPFTVEGKTFVGWKAIKDVNNKYLAKINGQKIWAISSEIEKAIKNGKGQYFIYKDKNTVWHTTNPGRAVMMIATWKLNPYVGTPPLIQTN